MKKPKAPVRYVLVTYVTAKGERKLAVQVHDGAPRRAWEPGTKKRVKGTIVSPGVPCDAEGVPLKRS